jgi:hypothetical protein
MPRISQLPSLATPDDADELAIVDASASVTKKITREDFFAGAPAVFTELTTDVLNVGSQTPTADWTTSVAPTTVTNNGNGSYTAVFNGTNLTGAINPGTRIRTTRTVAAPTQCASLNGTTNYFNDTSVAGMTFTDDFVAGAWVKLTSYGAYGNVISRFNGTSGWRLVISDMGQVILQGFNGSSANYRLVQSYQSIPLNKWVHISAQLDMSSFTATTTTCYITINGVDVPASVASSGTNPTALVQAGNLEIGSQNGGSNFFPGKLAQVFVTSAKVTQANVRALMSQGLALGDVATYSIVSAYSLNNTLNDINTTNANNLTAQGSAVATNADSPFGGQAIGTISSTLDYGIVQSASFSTNTTLVIQVPEGCTIPTNSSGVTSMSYSSADAPYGFPGQKEKWVLKTIIKVANNSAATTAGAYYNPLGIRITIPIGKWRITQSSPFQLERSGAGVVDGALLLATTTASATGEIPDSRVASYASIGAAFLLMPLLVKTCDYSTDTAQVLYSNYTTSTTGAVSVGARGDWLNGGHFIEADNSYL